MACIKPSAGYKPTKVYVLENMTQNKHISIIDMIKKAFTNISKETVKKMAIKIRLYENCYSGGATSTTIAEKIKRIQKTKKQHRKVS